MKLYEQAVNRPITTILVFIAIVLMGLFSYTRLAVDLYPKIELSALTILTPYPGANAAEVEIAVTDPIENVLNAIENVKKITSESHDNMSKVILEFQQEANLDEASNSIRDKIGLVKGILPKEAENSVIFRFNTTMIPILYFSVKTDKHTIGLEKILQDKVVNPLNRISGVGTVTISGAPRREIQVNAIPEKLEAYNLTIEQLATTIHQQNISIPGGVMDEGNKSFSLRLDSEIKESGEIQNIIVASHGGRNIYLRDVAVVSDTLQVEAQVTYLDTQKGAVLVIQKQTDANSIKVVEKIMEQIPEIQRSLPEGVSLEMLFSTADLIKGSISSLQDTILFATLFVILVVLAFLGRWRSTFIIVVTIPISLIASLFYLMISGNTINIISLSALSIAIGLVVDDAIVVLENITKHLERGSSPKQAAVYATGEVSISVIASSLTILAVFLPMTLTTGIAGALFKQLGWMIAIIITVSTLSALTLMPTLSALFLRLKEPKRKNGVLVVSRREKVLEGIENGYGNQLHWAIRHRKTTLFGVFGLLFLLIVVSAAFIKTDFFPTADNSVIDLKLELTPGSSRNYTRDVCLEVVKHLEERFPEIETMTFTMGSSSRASFMALQQNRDDKADFFIKLKPLKERRRDMFELSELIRIEIESFPEVHTFVVHPGGDSGGALGGGATVKVDVYGYDMHEADEVARELEQRLKSIEGLRDVQLSRMESRQEYSISFDREKLAFYGLNATTASTFIRNRIGGVVPTKYREDGTEYDIRVRFGEQYRQSLEDIENILIYSPQGLPLRVRDIAIITQSSAVQQIDHQNRQRVVSVNATLYDRALSEVVSDVKESISTLVIPSGIEVQIAGSFEDQQEAFTDLLLLLLVSIILVYVVMASQFESFTYPFIIMMTLPFSFTGSLLGLMIFGKTLNVMGMIGVIMLIGIVVKNGIILIEYINIQRARGLSILTAIEFAGRARLRPVLMTAATTALGMLPLALGIGEGAEFWSSMGLSVIGGLVLSTMLTLILVPALYAVFAGNGIKRQRRRYRKAYAKHSVFN